MPQTILTATGFDRPTLAELLQQIGDQMSNVVGPVNRNPNSGIGQIIGVFAEALGVSYEVAEELFNSRFIRSATGAALDSFGDWLGLPRRARTKTTSPVILYGLEGSMVPTGAIAAYANHNFTLDAPVTISNTNTTDITFRILPGIATGKRVGITIGSWSAGATAGANDNPTTLAATLATQITTQGTQGATPFAAVATGSDIRVTSSNLSQGVSARISSTATADGTMSILQIGTPGYMTAVETGPIAVPAGQLTKPVSGVAGWTGVTNPIDASVGADRESDTDYRKRLQNADGTINGLATPAAIKRAVSQVSGVTAVALVVNNKMANDTTQTPAQPGKSYQVIVEGGDPKQIVQAIYTAGGAGIETFGKLSDVYTDTDNEAHLVFFSRMSARVFDVNITVTFQNSEEGLTPSLSAVIEAAVRTYFAGLGLGDIVLHFLERDRNFRDPAGG